MYPGTGPSVMKMYPTETVEVALYYDHDCPLAESVRADLLTALGEAGLDWPIHDRVDRGLLSPTLLIGGVDVLAPQPAAVGCRLRRPSREQIAAFLEHYLEARP
jgi:hypothetical protein